MATIAEEENAILTQVLEQQIGSGGIIWVSPHTCWPYNSYIFDLADTNDMAQTKDIILCLLHRDLQDIGALIDQLFEKNAVFHRLTLPTPEDRRYVIDYNGSLSNTVKKAPGGRPLPWDPKPAPKYDLRIGVSRPAIDPANGRILVYVIRGNGLGMMGDIILYENKDGKLIQIARGTVVRS